MAAISPEFWVMLSARFVQGLGAAAVIPVGMAFVGENFPQEKRGRALGMWSMVNASAPAIGPTIGGILIELYNWRAIYWFSMILGVIGIVVVASFVPESKRKLAEESFDYAGSALLFLTIGSLLTLLSLGRTWGWVSVSSFTFIALALISGLLFLFTERRARHPLIDLKFVRSRAFLLSGLIVFLSFLIFQGSFFMLPFFLEQVQGYSASMVGNMAIPLFLALAIAAFYGGRLSDRFKAKYIVVAGTLLTVLAIYFFTWMEVNTPYWYILLIMGSLGLGVGISLPPLSRAVIGMVDPRKMGVVSGIFNLFRNLGGPFGIAISATVFGRYTRLHGMTSAVANVAWVLLGLCVLMFFIVLFLPNIKPLSRDRRIPQGRPSE